MTLTPSRLTEVRRLHPGRDLRVRRGAVQGQPGQPEWDVVPAHLCSVVRMPARRCNVWGRTRPCVPLWTVCARLPSGPAPAARLGRVTGIENICGAPVAAATKDTPSTGGVFCNDACRAIVSNGNNPSALNAVAGA